MATSQLQRYVSNQLDKHFPQYHIRENRKPAWLVSSDLTRLELDFYIEELQVAIEVQGAQHYTFIPFFHKSPDDFLKRQRLDKEKKNLCDGQNIKLIEIHTAQDIDIFIKKEIAKQQKAPKYSYQEQGIINGKFYGKHKRTSQKKHDQEFRKQERLIRCQEKIGLFINGELEASKSKVLTWMRTVREIKQSPD